MKGTIKSSLSLRLSKKLNNKRDDKIVPFIIRCKKLLLNDSVGRALSSASTALKALITIDLVVQVAHFNSFGRALRSAGAAGQALIGNNKSHNFTSVCILSVRH